MKMKKIIGASLLTAAMAASFQASAASTEMKVTGEISEGACNVTAQNNGLIDFGDILNASILAGTVFKLAGTPFTIDISCSEPTNVGYRIVDNRAESASPVAEPNLGIGFDKSGNKIGYLNLQQTDYALLDGNVAGGGTPAAHMLTRNAGVTWGNFLKDSSLRPIEYYSFNLVRASPLVPGPISTAVLTFTPHLNISPRETLDMTDEINIDGSVTLELLYL